MVPKIKLILLPLLFLLTGCTLHEAELDLETQNPTDNLQRDFSVAFSPSPDNTWIIMIYMDGAVDLEPYALGDFKELEYGLYLALQANPVLATCLEIIVLFDRIAGYTTDPVDDWTDTRLYRIKPAGSLVPPFESEILYDPAGTYGFAQSGLDTVERNMADPQTLQDFLDYAQANFPADHYALIVWNHGDGPRSLTGNVEPVARASGPRSIAVDEELPYLDMLSIQELQLALSQSELCQQAGKLDLVAFDACLMGSVEIAYELRDLAEYMVGSMANEWHTGWDYTALLAGFAPDSGQPDSRELAKLMVKAYREATIVNNTMQTLSAVALNRMPQLKEALDNLAAAIFREQQKTAIEALRDVSCAFYQPTVLWETINWPYHDLHDFCSRIVANAAYFSAELVNRAADVIATLATAMVAAYAGGSYGNYYADGSLVQRGLYLVFPLGDRVTETAEPLSYYAYADWYTATLLKSREPDASFVGQLDFCTVNSNAIVETWTELLAAWYDPAGELVPWNTF